MSEFEDEQVTAEQADEELDARCQAETQAGGNTYRCGLEEGHDGDHAFAAVDADDVPQERDDAAEPPADVDNLARITKIDKQLNGLRAHVVKRMGEILGEDAPLYMPCELCTDFGVPGFRPPIDLPIEVQSSLYHLLGYNSPSDYMGDTHSQVCGACAGYGEVATGSKVAGQDRLTCVECKGMGWIAVDETRRSGYSTATNGPGPSYPPPSPDASALPAMPAEDDPEVARLRQLGYAVIPPMVVGG